MKVISKVFTPTANRRLNELIGFVLCVFAGLLFLSLVSYSPLDASLNSSANSSAGNHGYHNWIGMVGAYVADLALQAFGLAAFLLVVFPAILGLRWFRSRRVATPVAKILGAASLVLFVPTLLGLLPGHLRWLHVIPVEGLWGRILGDFLAHYLNLTGAYIVSATLVAVALYLTTAFSFSSMHLWLPTRFAFVQALWQRWEDWKLARAKKRDQHDLEKRRAQKPVVTAKLVPAKQSESEPMVAPRMPATAPAATMDGALTPQRRTGIERMLEEQPAGVAEDGTGIQTPAVASRADPSSSDSGIE